MQNIDDATAGPFQQCSDCGTPVVHLGAHRCGTATTASKPHQQERLDAADQDPRADSDTVLIVPHRDNSGAYAYHEQSVEDTPVCGGPGKIDPEEYHQTTRRKAKRRGRAPCQSCANLREKSR